MNKEELERQLSGFISSIESKRSEISMLYNEYPVASVVRKSQIMNEIRRLNGEIAVLEDHRKNIEDAIKKMPTESLDEVEKEKLSNMTLMEATEYFNNSYSNRDIILKNMSVDQIISVINNVEDSKLYLNVIDDDKLLNVINNLDLNGLKKIFEKPKKDIIDGFEVGRENLINRLKGKDLIDQAIRNFKAIGYNDFDNQMTHINENPKLDNSDIYEIMSISEAKQERNDIKDAYESYSKEKSLDKIDDLSFNDLERIVSSKKLDDLLKRLENLTNKNIDKSNLNEYVNLYNSFNSINKNINNKRNELQAKLKVKQDEIDDVKKEMQKLSNKISSLNNEILKISDPDKKASKEKEISKLKEELDDLIDKYNYLNQGNNYFQSPAFKRKNKPIKYGPNAVKKSNNTNTTNNNKSKQTSVSQPVVPPVNQAQISSASQPVMPSANQSQVAPTSQPVVSSQIIPNSIKFYINNGTLPNNLTDSEYINLAKTLSIPAKDINYVLSDDELKRLLISKKVMMAIINKNVTKVHEKSINNYKDLIQKYEDILSNIDTYKHSEKEKKFIENVIKDLETKKNNYSDKVHSLGYDNASDYVNFENDRKNIEINMISKEIDKNEELLNQKYNELKKEQENLKNPKFKAMEGVINKKINQINKEIENLQQKQIELNKTQTMIINKNTNKYILKVKEKQQRYKDEQRLASAHAEKMLNIEYEKIRLEEERNKLNNDLSSMNPTNKKEEKQKNKTKRDLDKINRKIAALRLKEGYCSLENQVCQGVALSGYTK